MLRTLLFALLTLIVTPACSECTLTAGNYVDAGGSEESTTLNLSANKKFTIVHNTWQPGHYDKRKKTSSSGSWQCSQNQIILKFNNRIVKAEITTAGNNPLGIPKKTKVLNFSATTNSNFSYLANEILYLKSSLPE